MADHDIYGDDMRSVVLPNGAILPYQVLESGAGFYIGTVYESRPYSRESDRYWRTREEAQDALDTGKGWLPNVC